MFRSERGLERKKEELVVGAESETERCPLLIRLVVG